MSDFERETGKERVIFEDDRVLICRPKWKRAIAILRYVPDSLEKAEFVRHLIVRRRSLDDYDRAVIESVCSDENLLNAAVEFPPGGGKVHKSFYSVRYLMADRGIVTPAGLRMQLVPEEQRAWIQIHMGSTHRVWMHGKGAVAGFDTREEAVAKRDRMNVREVRDE